MIIKNHYYQNEKNLYIFGFNIFFSFSANLGDFRGALDNYDKAIEINYQNQNEEKYIFYVNRGNMKYELGEDKDACKDYKFAVSIGDKEGIEWLKSSDGEWCEEMKF